MFGTLKNHKMGSVNSAPIKSWVAEDGEGTNYLNKKEPFLCRQGDDTLPPHLHSLQLLHDFLLFPPSSFWLEVIAFPRIIIC